MAEEEKKYTQRRARFPELEGKGRRKDTGVLFEKYHKDHEKQPDFAGEVRFDLDKLDEIIKSGGVIKLSAWVKKFPKQDRGSYLHLKVNWWKPGDGTTAQRRHGFAYDVDEWEIPE